MSDPNGNGQKTPMLLSVYETDEQIQFSLCDKCAGEHTYQWLRWAAPTDICAVCKKPNAVDVCTMHDLWTLSPEDERTWIEYTTRLEGGQL